MLLNAFHKQTVQFFLKADNYIIVLRILYVTCTISKNHWSLISLFVVSLDMNAQLLETKDNPGGNVYVVLISLVCWGVKRNLGEVNVSLHKWLLVFLSPKKKIEKASMLINSYS